MTNPLLLQKPHVTEKSAMKTEGNNPVYTFVVAQEANKSEIGHAIKELYKVTPVKIHTVKVPSKAVFVRGKRGTKSGYKKAMVYLKKGDSIAFA